MPDWSATTEFVIVRFPRTALSEPFVGAKGNTSRYGLLFLSTSAEPVKIEVE
jgi:hypothetical protein